MAQDIFSVKPNKVTKDFGSYNFLLYSSPGIGKTTLASQMFPERTFILGFEYGFKGIPNVIGVPVPDYSEFLNYVDQLDTDEARERFDTLIIDTTTKVGEVIENFILSIFGKNSLGECKSHGGAYPLINRYYNLAFNRLKARGYNFVYICHSKTEDIKNDKGEVIGQRFLPKMSDRISSFIEPEVDYIFYLTLDKDGNRIIVTDNNTKSVGKQRSDLPLTLPLDIDILKKEFAKGVEKKAKGMVTDEKVRPTVVEVNKKSRPYTEIIAEIVSVGEELSKISDNKRKEGIVILNNKLGKDDNGVQRTLAQCTQENCEVLEVILAELKKLL